MKARNLAISIVFCLFLLGPAVLFVGQKGLHLELPDWFTAEQATYLSGESGKAPVKKHLSLKGFASEKLQDALDKALQNTTPCRAQALLLNASLQRSAIEASNVLFGYDAYPTFFNSARVYIPKVDALSTMPDNDPASSKERIENFATALNGFAAKMPDKKFCVILADAPDTTDANPSARLVSGHFSSKDAFRILSKNLTQSNVSTAGVFYADAKDYFENYYRTDHHWNGFGTIIVYNEAASKMALPAVYDSITPPLTFDDMTIEGSLSRKGLMFLNETACEPHLNFSYLDVSGKGPAPVAQADGVQKLLSEGLTAEYNFYSSWYGSYGMAQQSPISNPNAPLQENALIIMDSYGNSLHWLIAANYESTRCFKDTKQDTNPGATLAARIEESDADTVYFIGNSYAYADLLDVHPDYFGQ